MMLLEGKVAVVHGAGGAIGASARRPRRVRPGESPCRAAQRILALIPPKWMGPVGKRPWNPAHVNLR